VPADRFYTCGDRARSRPHLHDQELVLAGIDVRPYSHAEPHQLAIVQLAQKDAVLRVVTEAVQRPEDMVATTVVRDVVRDDIPCSCHNSYRVVMPMYAGTSPRSQRASTRACTRIRERQEQR
jgi:hypothetical protein